MPQCVHLRTSESHNLMCNQIDAVANPASADPHTVNWDSFSTLTDNIDSAGIWRDKKCAC